MKAIQYHRYGGYEELELVDVPVPIPREGEVLVRMRTASVNPIDNHLRSGMGAETFGKPLPITPGVEGVGEIVESAKASLPIGSRVLFRASFGLLHDGLFREYVAAAPRHLVPLPDTIGDAEATTLQSGFLTAQMALEVAGFRPGMSIVSTAVGGAVGNAVAQLARIHDAARVITTAGSSEKAEQARAAGYADVIDLSRESLSEGVHRLTLGAGVDLVFDSVCGPLVKEGFLSLKNGGTLVLLGFASGQMDATIPVERILTKDLRLTHYELLDWLLDRPSPQMNGAWDKVIFWAAQRQIKPLIARTFPLEQAAEASRHLMEARPFGKVVLSMGM